MAESVRLGKMKRKRIHPIFVLVAALYLMSCASTSWTRQWRDSGYSGEVKKLFVVAAIPNRGPRMIIENELVSQFKEHGVTAIGSTELLHEEALPTRDTVEPLARAAGADAVLVVKFIKKETLIAHSPGNNPGVPVTFDANMDTLFQFPETTPRDLPSDYYLATMQLTIYHVATGKPVWSAVSETKYEGGGIKQAKPYARAVVRKLMEEKLVK
jgi:hypothetical protein